VPSNSLNRYIFLGELSLDGLIRPVKGALPISVTAKNLGLSGIFLPSENANEAAVVEGIDIYPVSSLSLLVECLCGLSKIMPLRVDFNRLFETPDQQMDFSDVRGQENVKRAMEIAAAGGHNIIML